MTASVQIETTKKGTQYYYIYISYTDPATHKHKKKKVSTGLPVRGNKRKAQAMIPDLLKKYAYLEEYRTPEQNILFTDYLKRWLQMKKIEIKTSTYEGYEYRMAKILEYFEPQGKLLQDITPAILNEYFHWSLLYGKVSQKDGSRSGLAPRTVREHKNLLFAAFNQAIVDGLVPANPAINLKVGNKRRQDYAEEDLFLTKKEAEDMLRFLDQSEKYHFLMPMAFIMTYFGLRRSELLGLEWKHIDLENNVMYIRQTVTRIKTCEISDMTKTPAGRRDLPIFPLAKECLEQVRKQQEQNRTFFGDAYHNERNFVFTWEDGRSYDPDFITKKFKAAMTEYGNPGITPHKLRHTCASFLIEKGWDTKQVQYWMGHEDIQTTLQIYAHYDKKNRLDSTQEDLMKLTSGVSDLFDEDVVNV